MAFIIALRLLGIGNATAGVASCRSRLLQSCRLYHIFRLLSLFFILIIPSLFLADTADAVFGTTTVDNTSSADTGQYTSIAVGTSGAAYISYYNSSTADDLMYATNVSGSFGTTTVDSTGIVGLWTSIEVGTSGAAYISYYDQTNTALKYATNVSGSFVTTTVDNTSSTITGEYTSIAVGTSGAAYISYYNSSTSDDLMYATNVSGSFGTTTVDSTGITGLWTSIAVGTSGAVYISYYDSSNSALKYATNVSGSFVTTTLDSTGVVGEYTSIAVGTSGAAYISYYDNTNDALKYATNVSGSWGTTTVDTTSSTNVGQYTSIAVGTSGAVYISYYDVIRTALMYATNVSGSFGTTTVDDTGNTGQYTSIEVDTSGAVYISYYDVDRTALMYATNLISPTVVTGVASGVTQSSATLRGTVNANGWSTTAMFRYGTASGLYTGTSTTQSVSGESNTAVSIGISGLSANTPYYYRIAANNAAGTSTGSEASFTTTSVPPPQPTPIPETLTVISTSPTNGATDVAVNTTVSATFSLFVNGSTVTTDTFTLSDGTSLVSGVVSTNGATVTFTPSANLANGTTYTATLTTGIRAANFAGTQMTSNYTWSFTTVDTTKPIISSTSPVNGAIGVAINSSITATFSEAMQSSTINTNTFTVSDGSGNIEGIVSYSGTTATFTPSSNLSHFTTYMAMITTGVRDLAGNAMASNYTWGFTTTDDADPPTVSSTIPPNGAAGVNVNSNITATFSEAMQSSTINTNTFTVSDGSGNIGGTVSYSGTTATFTPSSNLSDSTTYTAQITTGVRDLAGNAMASPYTWSFATTAGGADIIPPTVNSTNPANGVAEVDVSSTIIATFSETMQSSTINTDTFTVNDGSGNIGGTVSYSGATATFTPSANLDFNTIYKARITTGAMDLTGNVMVAAYTWSFTTELAPVVPTPTPTVTTSQSPTPTATPVGMVTTALDLSKYVAYLNGDTIVARVVDADRDTNTSTADILTTTLKAAGTTYFSGDLLLDMVENDVNSGTFLATVRTGTTTTGSADSDVRSNYGIIKTEQGGTATVIYRDTTPLSASLTKDVYFSSYDATVEFSAESYPLDSYASVTLADAEENTDHTEAETLLEHVFIRTSASNFAAMECIETGADTGTFMGSILVSNAPTEDKKNIQASEGQTLTVSSQDEINTFGAMRIVSDTALVVAAVTEMPTPTPTVTPTPESCDVATAITSSSSTVTVAKGNSTTVTITVTGANGCAVVDDKVKATSNNTSIATVSPSKLKTDANGQATFTITGNKKGSAKITFKETSASLKTKVKVEVTK